MNSLPERLVALQENELPGTFDRKPNQINIAITKPEEQLSTKIQPIDKRNEYTKLDNNGISEHYAEKQPMIQEKKGIKKNFHHEGIKSYTLSG